MKQWLKRWVFRLLGKDPEAVVVTFCTGPEELCRRMAEEVRGLVPDRRHFVATAENWSSLRRELKRYRIGLAPVMLTREAKALRRAAYRMAPRRILAYNSRLERRHLRLNLASLLFWLGVPLDRIYLRPWWWPWPKRDRSVVPQGWRILEGRPCSPERRRVAVLSPYFPYPLSHGGAVRIFHLLREMAREFDVELFAFQDRAGVEPAPLEFCARLVLVEKPRYREPRWSTLLPPEVHEFRSPAMRQALVEERRAFGFETLQVEYTQLAEYGGDFLVEHDVTFDLFGQIARRERTLAAWWNYFRWRRFEMRHARRFRRVVVMSKKDAELLGPAVPTAVIENGVDLARFHAEPEQPGRRLLFIGSFQHFPNVAAYRFFTGKVWPLLRDLFPDMTLTVVCGADHLTHWRAFTDSPEPAADGRIRLLGFVADVRPLYVEANLAIVPTTVSAGTNLKVLEAMAMRRAVVSTTSGCAGLGLLHGHSVWVADAPEAFAAGIATLMGDAERRAQIADAAYWHAVRNFDWAAIGEKQRGILKER
ncbi:MAG: glycosyltransferase family 4 protein [Acidobacteriia bacterium]|nr:glycosyltransferase family 4 protein [Terriglobia bacterium]